MLAATALVAVGAAAYPVVMQDHVKWGVGMYNALLFNDDGPTDSQVASSRQMEARLASVARLLRDGEMADDTIQLIHYYSSRHPDFQARFQSKLGDPETALNDLVAADHSLITLPALRAKREAFDSLMSEMLISLMRTRELDWGANGATFQDASEMMEQFGRMGSGFKYLQTIRAGEAGENLQNPWFMPRAVGEAFLQKVESGTLDPKLADLVLAEILAPHPVDSAGNRSCDYEQNGQKISAGFADPSPRLLAMLGKNSFTSGAALIEAIRNLQQQKPTSVAGYRALATQQSDLQELIGQVLFFSTLKDKILDPKE